MLNALKLSLIAAALVPTFTVSFANAAGQTELASHSSCSARAIDRFYCPGPAGDWWGPYFDNGCSVKCDEGQTATCTEATCEDFQTGQSVASSCSCN